jgi:hypothetical protein
MQRAVMLHPVSQGYRSPSSSLSSSSGSRDGSACAGACTGSCKSAGGVSSSKAACCGGSGCSGGAATGEVLRLDVADFYGVAVTADRQRHDVMELLPWMRGMLDSGLWPYGLFRMVQWMFPLLVVSLLLGPQVSELVRWASSVGCLALNHTVCGARV